ncbi:MAG: helix-turn-helix transcriptional regulator [Deltaproteobacteria bacterium]|nr:helix-turn-helix transcriptional regulator [Deltaproteobacteria bacterium]
MPQKKAKRSGREPAGAHDFLTQAPHPERGTAAPAPAESVGDRIRRARETHGLTLHDLSARSGIGAAELERVEANETVPPLGELVRLGKALRTRMSYLVSPGMEKPMTVVRADARRPFSRYGDRRRAHYGYSYESLAPEKAGRLMEPFVVTLRPTEANEPSAHDGQEFLFVLEGEMMAQVGDQTEILGPGDAIYYDSSQSHLVTCASGKQAKVLAVIYAGQE